MEKMYDFKKGQKGIITGLTGDFQFISRATSMGLTPGTLVEIVQNVKRMPMIIYARDTEIALDRNNCANILVKEVK